MSNKFTEPWSQQEKVQLLINVLQVQHQRLDFLGFLVHSVRQSPLPFPWNEVALPEGRSLLSCQSLFDTIVPRPPQQYPQNVQVTSPYPGATQQRYASFDADQSWLQQTQPRPIQPRPSRSTDSPNPASTNGETLTIVRTTGVETREDRERQRKKRGRPTKEEAEERDRQLAAEGKTYEPKRRPIKKPRPSTGTPVPTSDTRLGMSPSAQTTPLPQTIEPKDESSSGKRRSKRQASLTHGEPSSPTMRTTERMDEKAAESPSDRLLARNDHRERASREAPGPMTTPLPHEPQQPEARP